VCSTRTVSTRINTSRSGLLFYSYPSDKKFKLQEQDTGDRPTWEKRPSTFLSFLIKINVEDRISATANTFFSAATLLITITTPHIHIPRFLKDTFDLSGMKVNLYSCYRCPSNERGRVQVSWVATMLLFISLVSHVAAIASAVNPAHLPAITITTPGVHHSSRPWPPPYQSNSHSTKSCDSNSDDHQLQSRFAYLYDDDEANALCATQNAYLQRQLLLAEPQKLFHRTQGGPIVVVPATTAFRVRQEGIWGRDLVFV
jgi:hypothetical protein